MKSPLAPNSSAAWLASVDQIFQALAHPARRQILMTIHFRGGAMAAGDIAARFAHAWPTTTRHLNIIAAAGLVRRTRKGKSVTYEVDPTRLDLVKEWLIYFDVETPS